MNKYENCLSVFDENQWLTAIDSLLPSIHDVDRNATAIWFRFFPLELKRFLDAAEDRDKTIQKFVIQGDFTLIDQIDLSHSFLYGHRFWKDVKHEIKHRAESFDGETVDVAAEARSIADVAAKTAKVDASLLIGLAAIGLMTLVQVGWDEFKRSPGTTGTPHGLLTKNPDQIVAERAKDDSQGVFGFLKTVDKTYTVNWQDSRTSGSFRIKNDADIATASALDQSQNWRSKDERCWEGVVPVECRSAACGTCWVGIVGGQEKLSEVQPLERKQMKIFGYRQADEAKPYLRLACQAKASGNVSIVIPPWNGVFGKKIYGVEESRLEPATTSAKKLRETLAAAGGSDE
ncbi:MAG: (2Fe-2S)-binding protein [Acidobacteria bacterium]|nr:(2Fe-2S)-binding protein [Acidobacteriota bacterium]MBK8146793.1 (2Fe-2S)-binding protein [Acidobacteriota bacterium]MBK8813037.1 (2Fe-2S)-binding protein [Acidobacteriota bacterium]